MSRNESAELVESVLAEISDALARGETVKISSFGSFSVRQKGQRVGRNPKTGEEVPISPRRVLVFRASHVLKDQINARTVEASSDAAPHGAPAASSRRRRGRAPERERTARRARRRSRRAAFRTISEVAGDLDVPQHVLRFWESKFPQIKPLKRARRPALLPAGGRGPAAPHPPVPL